MTHCIKCKKGFKIGAFQIVVSYFWSPLYVSLKVFNNMFRLAKKTKKTADDVQVTFHSSDIAELTNKPHLIQDVAGCGRK